MDLGDIQDPTLALVLTICAYCAYFSYTRTQVSTILKVIGSL